MLRGGSRPGQEHGIVMCATICIALSPTLAKLMFAVFRVLLSHISCITIFISYLTITYADLVLLTRRARSRKFSHNVY